MIIYTIFDRWIISKGYTKKGLGGYYKTTDNTTHWVNYYGDDNAEGSDKS